MIFPASHAAATRSSSGNFYTSEIGHRFFFFFGGGGVKFWSRDFFGF